MVWEVMDIVGVDQDPGDEPGVSGKGFLAPGIGKGKFKMPQEGKGNLMFVFPGIAGNGNSRSPLLQCNALLPCCCQSGDLAAGGLRLGCPQNTRGRETRNGGRYLLRFDFFSPEAFEWP